MVDVSPALLDKMREAFGSLVSNDAEVAGLLKRLQAEAPKYSDAQQYAIRIGELLGNCFGDVLTESELPNATLYYNIAKAVVEPMLLQDQQMVADVAGSVITALNEAAGIGVAAQTLEPQTDRIAGIIEDITNQQTLAKAIERLKADTENFSAIVADKTLERNVEFQTSIGKRPKIVREYEGPHRRRGKLVDCNFCKERAGSWNYEQISKRGSWVYQRHEGCRCTTEYYPDGSKRKRQNVWDKAWNESSTEKLKQKRQETFSNGLRIGTDVTAEYYKNEKPGIGSVRIPDDYRRDLHGNEIKMANTLLRVQGGVIELLKESTVDGEKTPDYLWNGKLWDLKTTSTAKAANSAVRKGIKQIDANPGGVILDYGNHKFNLIELNTIIERRVRGSKPTDLSFDVLIISNNQIVEVIRY